MISLRVITSVWKGDFVKTTGSCSIFEVELWGILEGLKLVCDLGFRKIIVESDSLSVVMVINGAKDGGNNMKNIIQIILRWISKDWHASVCHVHPEGNQSANSVAGIGISMTEDWNSLHEPPNFVVFVCLKTL